MKSVLMAVTAFAMLGLAVTPAFAQPGDGRRAFIERRGQEGPRMDLDGDGFITRAEAKTAAERIYDARAGRGAQANEAPRLRGALPFAGAEEADRNGDGQISKEEFVTQQLRFFDAADASGDGRLKAPARPPAEQ